LTQKYTEGRTVLNMFGYTGGFSCIAMKNAAIVSLQLTVPFRQSNLQMKTLKLNYGDDKRHESFQVDGI